MPEFRIQDLVDATGGKLVRGDGSATVSTFGIDTRSLKQGSVFFALKGEHTDGHKFLPQAAEAGASAAFIDESTATDARGPKSLIRVESVEQALTDCGALAREQLDDVRWIAITGSNGKTSTKELLAEGLSASHKVHRTPGNFNNHLGVPLTLLACPDDAEFAVIELAMSGFGEIAALTELVRPEIGIITNIRAVHLEYFDSIEDIAAAKGELFAVMGDDATAVYNIDNSHMRVQATRHMGPQISFGRSEKADVRILEVANRFFPGTSLVFSARGEKFTMHLKLGGAHSAFNALTAVAGLIAAGEELEPAIEKMEQLESGAGRGRVHHLRDDIVLVDDSYNSSPAALASVLETLRVSEVTGRRILVMGDMLELGSVEGALHREAGKRAAAVGVDLLFSVGNLARQAAESGRRGGVSLVHHFPDADKAAEEIGGFLRPGDLVLVKGSRSVHLEKVVRQLCTDFAGVL